MQLHAVAESSCTSATVLRVLKKNRMCNYVGLLSNLSDGDTVGILKGGLKRRRRRRRGKGSTILQRKIRR